MRAQKLDSTLHSPPSMPVLVSGGIKRERPEKRDPRRLGFAFETCPCPKTTVHNAPGAFTITT